jgi:hypothetical protein
MTAKVNDYFEFSPDGNGILLFRQFEFFVSLLDNFPPKA